MSSMGLSKGERARLDALLVRVRQGDHYEVLGLHAGATEAEILEKYQQLRQFLDPLLAPGRELGEHQMRAEVVLRAVENARRIVGNPRERIRYDTQQAALARPSDEPPRPDPPAPPRESVRSTAARSLASAMRAPHLIALLEAHLSTLLGRPVDLRAFAGGSLELRDPTAATRSAEEAERRGRWDDAVLWWHLAGLAAPTDGGYVLRAASALRRAGVPTAFEHYARVAQRHEVFRDDLRGGEPGGGDGVNSS